MNEHEQTPFVTAFGNALFAVPDPCPWCGGVREYHPTSGGSHRLHSDGCAFFTIQHEHDKAVAALSARVAKLEAEQSEARNRAARLEAALREIAGRGPKDDPCADEYDADGKRWSEVGGEATWCTYTSDESQEESAHASDVAAYAAAKIARAALEEPCKGDSPEAAEEDKS